MFMYFVQVDFIVPILELNKDDNIQFLQTGVYILYWKILWKHGFGTSQIYDFLKLNDNSLIRYHWQKDND